MHGFQTRRGEMLNDKNLNTATVAREKLIEDTK